MGKEKFEFKEKEVPMYDVAGDENVERGNWSSKFDFLFSLTGYAVGLGNLWRFPYIAYANGGGSFLFPYVIMLIFTGLPMFFLEMTLGQFGSLGPISVWKAVPFFKGLGVAMVVISSLVSIYYNMVIAYTVFYLVVSMQKTVPWQYCKPEWQGLGCVDRVLTEEQILARNITKNWCASMEDLYGDNDTLMSVPGYTSNCTLTEKTPSLVYWEHEVLGISKSIEVGSSDFKWWLVLSLFGVWLLIFFTLIKGVKSSGKVVYVTATFPYIMLFILLIRNATLEGARSGIEFYIIPTWEELTSVKPWYEAAVQIFYSLGVAFGGVETMASYNRFHNNLHSDALIVAFINCGTSVFAGFVIFSVIGHLSFVTGKPVDAVISGAGPGLAFVGYTEGIAMLPLAPLWSILFFLMLLTLGLDTQFTIMETVITSIVDEFPWLRRKGKRKILFTLCLCFIFFVLGLPQCAANGVYIMELFNWYSAGFSVIVVAMLEIIVISYIYGVKRVHKDIKMMLGENGLFRYLFWPYWFPNWVFFTPALLFFLFIMSCLYHAPIASADYPEAYPPWTDSLGWILVIMSLGWIPVMAVVEYGRQHEWRASCQTVLTPKEAWGPALPKYRIGVYGKTFIPPPEYSVYNVGGSKNSNSDLDLSSLDMEEQC